MNYSAEDTRIVKRFLKSNSTVGRRLLDVYKQFRMNKSLCFEDFEGILEVLGSQMMKHLKKKIQNYKGDQGTYDKFIREQEFIDRKSVV